MTDVDDTKTPSGRGPTDSWKHSETTCISCNDGVAAPGEKECDFCQLCEPFGPPLEDDP